LSHKLRQLVEQFKLEKYDGDSPNRSHNSPTGRHEPALRENRREEVFTR
jgi:hypothetical protein